MKLKELRQAVKGMNIDLINNYILTGDTKFVRWIWFNLPSTKEWDRTFNLLELNFKDIVNRLVYNEEMKRVIVLKNKEEVIEYGKENYESDEQAIDW